LFGISAKPTYEPNLEIRAAKSRPMKNDNKEQLINSFHIVLA